MGITQLTVTREKENNLQTHSLIRPKKSKSLELLMNSVWNTSNLPPQPPLNNPVPTARPSANLDSKPKSSLTFDVIWMMLESLLRRALMVLISLLARHPFCENIRMEKI